MHPGPVVPIRRYGLQAKCIFACRNHGQSHRVTIPAGVHMFGFEPRAEARIVNFRLALPEIWRQSALDAEMIQLQFDGGHFLGKISPYIICTDD